MKCQFPDCITILSTDNKNDFCRLHARVLYQYDILYEKGRFYKLIDVKIASRNKKSKIIYKMKQKKRFIPLEEIKALKETVNIVDMFSEDKLDIGFPYTYAKK